MKTFMLLALTGLLLSYPLVGKSNTNELYKGGKPSVSSDKVSGKIKIFIEGELPDEVFMRKNISFVDFVNDPAVADVHIIVNGRKNGGGGTMYSIMYNNVSFDNMGDFTISCSSVGGDTYDEVRALLVKTIKMGLMPFVNQSEISDKFVIRYKNNDDGETEEEFVDPWRNWTFKGGIDGYIDNEVSQKTFYSSYDLSIDRVTEDWRIRNLGRTSKKTSDILRKGNQILDTISSAQLNSSVVKSITERWSVGAFAGYSNSTKNNTFYSMSIKPAIEYNIFPWDKSDRKVLTLAYYIGPEWKKYYDLTRYDKMNDFNWEHSLNLDLKLVNTWGEVNAYLHSTNLISDLDKYRVTMGTWTSIRVVRGISIRFRFNAASIHDQIYLRKGEVSLEEQLLNSVKLETNYELFASMGFSFQFGSIYNNIVNNRL